MLVNLDRLDSHILGHFLHVPLYEGDVKCVVFSDLYKEMVAVLLWAPMKIYQLDPEVVEPYQFREYRVYSELSSDRFILNKIWQEECLDRKSVV